MAVRFPWMIVTVLGLVAIVLGARLGLKTVRLTETDIIDHYVSAYLATMQSSGLMVDSGYCHAEPGGNWWERLRVVCDTPSSDIWVYSIGHWGQLLGGHPQLNPGGSS